MTTDNELCNALRGWITTNFPAQPVPIPPQPIPTYPNKELFCAHVEAAPNRLGNIDKPPSLYGLQLDMIRMLAIWASGADKTGAIEGQPATYYNYVCWKYIHTAPGIFDWRGFDAYVAAMKAWGINGMVLTLHSPPAWVGGTNGTNPTTTNVKEFITAVIKRAPGFIKAVENWNEFNAGTNIFSGTGAQLAAIQQALYQAAKAADPTVIVTSPTLTNAQNNPPPPYPPNQGVLPLKPFLDAGGAQWCDVIAVHCYLYGTNAADYSAQINRVMQNTSALFAQYGKPNLPIWMTEGGPENPSLITTQAARAALVKIYLDGMISNKVARMFWYTWDNFATLWSNGNLTDYGTAMQAYRKTLGI